MSAVENTESSGSNIGKIIGCGCAALVLIGILGGAAAFFGMTKLFKSNAPYTDSIAAVEASAAAVEALGEPIKPGIIPTGNISTNNGEGTVDFQIGVSGPKGKGTIIVKGSKPAGGSWDYETWELRVEGREEPIPLP